MEMKIRVLPDDLKIPIPDPSLSLAVEIALTTALRESEVLSLRVEQFAAGAKVIEVKVKGGRFEPVYFPSRLLEAIKRFTRDHRRVDEGWLFVGRQNVADGHPKPRMARSTLVWAWHEVQGAAGILPRFRFHDLRHTAITRFYLRTRDIEKTRMFARHRNISTTQVYTHVRADEVWKEMEESYEVSHQ
jgi:integrase